MKVPRILFFIFGLALLVRIFQLNALPVGFHADEVRVGWNTYSILKTLKDDRGNAFALYYNTFGDYRPTGIFYATAPSILLFGLSEFATRFPSAIFGALSIFPLYFLALRLTKKHSIAIVSSFFLALSPWHISVSRATSEVVISQFFALSALALLIYAIEKNKKRMFSFVIFLFGVSFIFYHSIRLLAPLFVLVIFASYFNKVSTKTRHRIFLTLIGIVFLTAIFVSSAGGRGRFSQVSILHSNEQVLGIESSRLLFDAPIFTHIKTFVGEYSSYFSGEFLVGSAAKPLRYASPDMGILTFAELALIIIGVFLCIRNKSHPVLLLLLLVSIIPAALTREDSPNLHRSLFMLPFFSILAAIGSDYFLHKKKIAFAIIFIFFSTQWSFFWHSYSERAVYSFGGVRNEAAKQLALYLNEVQNDYKEIILTHDPDDPYPWYAYFTKKDPAEFNDHAIKRSQGPWHYQNILFTQKDCPSDAPIEENVLVVDGFKCAVESKIKDGMQAKIVKQFKNSDGSVAYTLWEKD